MIWTNERAPEVRLTEVVAGECISNDPVVGGEAQYKPWSGPFGSARPIRGLHYRYRNIQYCVLAMKNKHQLEDRFPDKLI